MHDFLVAQGVPTSQVRLADPPSRGERRATAAGEPDGNDNQEWRRTSVYAVDLADHLVFVSDGPAFDPSVIAPSAIGGSADAPANAYIYVYQPEPLGVASGSQLGVDGTEFGLSGAAVSGGPASVPPRPTPRT